MPVIHLNVVAQLCIFVNQYIAIQGNVSRSKIALWQSPPLLLGFEVEENNYLSILNSNRLTNKLTYHFSKRVPFIQP
jgi:hypothetical protein